MKKIVSLVLAMALLATMFVMLGSVTASAETYYVSKTLLNLTFDGDAPYGIPGHRGNSPVYKTEANGNGYLYVTQPNANGAVFFLGANGNVGKSVLNVYSYGDQLNLNDVFKFEGGKTYRVSFDIKYLKGTGAGATDPNDSKVSITAYGNTDALVRTFTDPSKGHTAEPNKTDKFELANRVKIITKNFPTVTWTPDADGKLAEDTDWYKAEYVFSTNEGDPGFAFAMNPGALGKTLAAYDNIKVEEVYDTVSYNDNGVVTMDKETAVAMAGINSFEYVDDAEKGRVIKIDSGNGRLYFTDTPEVDVSVGHKYYLTFEAKTAKAGNALAMGLCSKQSPTGCRWFLTGYNTNYQYVSFFRDGKLVDYKETGSYVVPDTNWHTYGVVIDTSSQSFKEQTTGKTAQDLVGYNDTNDIYFFFGGQDTVAYFDNIKVVAMDTQNYSTEAVDESAKYSIRKDSNDGSFTSAGLRFRGTVAADVKANADEIGFVIAPSSIGYSDADWYKLDSLNASAKTATAYVKGGKDVVYEETAAGTSYQLILSKLSNEQGDNIFARRFAAVMYVKSGDTVTYMSLGEVSYNEILAEYAVRGN